MSVHWVLNVPSLKGMIYFCNDGGIEIVLWHHFVNATTKVGDKETCFLNVCSEMLVLNAGPR